MPLDKPGRVRLEKHSSFQTELSIWDDTRFRGTSDGQTIFCGKSLRDGSHVVQGYSSGGKLQYSWPVHTCADGKTGPHSILNVGDHHIVMSCTRCSNLIQWEPNEFNDTATERAIFTDETRSMKPHDICRGPNNSILAVNDLVSSKSVSHYRWKGDNLALQKKVQIGTDYPPYVIYDEKNNLIIVSNWRQESDIWAYNLQTSDQIWRFGVKNGKVIDGIQIQPCGLALDPVGRLYVADGNNSRVLVADVKTGKFQQCIGLPDLGIIRDISWGNQHFMYPNQHMLTVMHTTHKGMLGVKHFAICSERE